MTIYKGTVPIAGLAKNTIVNGFHIFDCKWADHLLEDISWLRADQFSYHSGSVYVTAYNELVSEYNNASSTTETEGSITFKRTPKGYKIADASQETAILNKYNTDGIAWYYILDTANTRFKLPRCKYKYWKNFSNNTLPVKGNGKILGLQGSGGTGGLAHIASYWLGPCSTNNVDIGTSISTSSDSVFPVGQGIGVITDATKSGIVTDVSNAIEETGFYLYFYVGEYTQSAIEQTAGITSEQLNAKVDVASLSTINPMIVSYVNGTSGYNIWSNGYCEQWGQTGSVADLSNTTINLAKTFNDTNYIVLITQYAGVEGSYTNGWTYKNKTTSQFVIVARTGGSAYASWKACGYLAEGQYTPLTIKGVQQ